MSFSHREGLRVRPERRRLHAVLGDQLDPQAAPLRELDPQRDALVYVEAAGEARHVPSHRQRTTLFLAGMRHHALAMRERGLAAHYLGLDDEDAPASLGEGLARAVDELGAARLTLLEPGEWRIRQEIEDSVARAGLTPEFLRDEHFLVFVEDFAKWREGRKELVLEHFYRFVRKRLGILVDGRGKPEGGRWNYDAENRESFDAAPEAPLPPRFEPDEITRELMHLVEERFPDAPGSLESFGWPVTREEALLALDDFIEHRLPLFGRYQDAMWTGEPFLYHSLLSPALNLHLLDPRECVERAVAAYEAGHAPLAAVEGFVRQIVGWREFIRGVYWTEGPGYGARNELGAEGKLPSLYWSGETDMRCLAESVGQVLDHAYGHHIQRLMITGLFALTAGVHPREISDWYLGMYADAVDWVTLPNTLGMAMHADGGVVGTKPYAASGRYVSRMSNYCASCRYDPGRRQGEDACPFTLFYWDFLARHRERFAGNRRMTMMLKHVERMSEEELEGIRQQAAALREELGITSSRRHT